MPNGDPVKILSYGGGLNSFTMLLYSIEQNNPPDWCVFADTGSGNWEEWSRDGEWYGTYRHIVEYVIPICEANEIGFKWITHEDSKIRGHDSLFGYFEYLRTVPGRQNRFCSEIAKIERLDQWVWETFGETPVEVWIGFEAGEENRRNRDRRAAKTCGQSEGEAEEPGAMPEQPKYRSKHPINKTTTFPLIGAGFCRCRCEVFVRDHDIPVPRKSACWFCPYGKRGDWMTLAQQMPDQFDRAAMMEQNQKGTKAGKLIYFNEITRKKKKIGVPLYEDINRPYTPQVEQCKVCCRYPKATKAPGIDFLTAAEYVQYEEPLGPWQPNPWDPGYGPDPWAKELLPEQRPPSCDERTTPYIHEDWVRRLGQADAVVAPDAVALPSLNLTQQNILQWLGARLGRPVVEGVIAIPVDQVGESARLLDWFHRHTQIDRDLDPDAAPEVVDLQERLASEARTM